MRPRSMLVVLASVLLATGALAEPAAFPESWFGVWRGPMLAAAPGGPAKEFITELEIGPTDDPARFRWIIRYIDGDRRDERPYELIAVDAAAGKYVVDEKNSIVLEASLIGDALCSQFAMGEMTLTALYRMDGERLTIDFVTSSTKGSKTTGGVDQVPEVTVTPVTSAQRAALTRQ